MTVNKFIIEVLKQVQLLANLKVVFQSFKSQIQSHIIQSMSYTPEQLKRKYHLLCEKYEKNVNLPNNLDWIENQKKIFINLLMAFCYVNKKKISQITDNQWILVSEALNNKNLLLLKYEIHSIEKKHLRVIWNQLQESLLQQQISSHSDIDWNKVSHFIYFQSKGKYFKTPKQCRQHWFNHLNQKIVKGNWSYTQDLVILQTVMQKGKKWAQIVIMLDNRRTEHMIKNRFNSLIRCAKKLINTNKEEMNQNEIIVFMKQKISSRRQCSKNRSKQKKQIQNLKQEDKINRLSYNIPQIYQFHPCNNQKQQITKQKVQKNQLKVQFSESILNQQNFINFHNIQIQDMAEKIKIEHIQHADNTDKSQETISNAVSSNFNLTSSVNLVGFYPNQIYIGQPYNYYYPTLLYPLI